jgi:Protein of unknown function (DUF3604)
VQENNHHGKLPVMDGTAALRLGEAVLMPSKYLRQKRWGAAGLAAVWAQQNTRESVFDALARRETYATSGPRMSLRFFGGFNYREDMLSATDLLARAYRDGVPMGGELSGATSPRFALWVTKDPQGANLDRLQIIKGWVDEQGVSHEQIFDVAASDNRQVDASGKLAAVGNTVDVASASYSNTIGAAELKAFWVDPQFDSTQQAFYYARALEIPTPRWSTFDAMRLGVEAPLPTSLQERAVSSAIWYRPE